MRSLLYKDRSRFGTLTGSEKHEAGGCPVLPNKDTPGPNFSLTEFILIAALRDCADSFFSIEERGLEEETFL